MVNLNEQQKAIFKEEIGRACFIMHAQNRLDEHDFNIFMQELRDYEANLVITESNQGEFLYEGFFDRLNCPDAQKASEAENLFKMCRKTSSIQMTQTL